MSENVCYSAFWAWFISLSLMISGFIHFPANDMI
jgi:hypothetical protein